MVTTQEREHGQSKQQLASRAVRQQGQSNRRTDFQEKPTMNTADIRWQQRLQNFCKALTQLDEAMALMQVRELSKLEKQGVIQAFEYSYELAWNTLKDFLIWQGIEDVTGSRDTIREAFSKGLIEEGQKWMNMLADRNRTSHTYNEETAEAILGNIRNHHHALLKNLQGVLLARAAKEA
jgi:nucleotidyltransferase substrate binding protein (TIGR01987 family)